MTTTTSVITTRTSGQYPQGNSANIVWPADKYGFTTELKKALIHAAHRVGKDSTKKALFDSVIALGVSLVEDKYNQKLGS